MASAIFKTAAFTSLNEAAETLRTQLLQAQANLPANALDLAGMSFFATNVANDGFQFELIGENAGENGLADVEAAKAKGGYIFVANTKEEIGGNDGKTYKIPSRVVLIETPSAESILADKGAQAAKFVRAALKAALGANARQMVSAFASKGIELSADASRFTVTKEQGNPEKAFDKLWPLVRDVLVTSAQANARTASVINSKTVTKDSVKSAFESQAAANAIFGDAIKAEHWDKLIAMCGTHAPNFTRQVGVKDPATNKVMKELGPDGKERSVTREVHEPLSTVYFDHCIATRHEVVSEVDMPQIEALDFSSLGGGIVEATHEPVQDALESKEAETPSA